MSDTVQRLPCLPYPVAPVLRLRVHGRVPVRVVEDDGVGPGQVDADAAGPRGQDEAEVARGGVEALHQNLTLLHPVGEKIGNFNF